jgi:clan AA aspartic protease (TIGR02281 family)
MMKPSRIAAAIALVVSIVVLSGVWLAVREHAAKHAKNDESSTGEFSWEIVGLWQLGDDSITSTDNCRLSFNVGPSNDVEFRNGDSIMFHLRNVRRLDDSVDVSGDTFENIQLETKDSLSCYLHLYRATPLASLKCGDNPITAFYGKGYDSDKLHTSQDGKKAQQVKASDLSDSLSELDPVSETDHSITIPYVEQNGVMIVKASVNGYPATFIFDSGAGEVTISSSMLSILIANGVVESSDLLGIADYGIADGSSVHQQRVNLKAIDVGSIRVSNVTATVTNDQNASFLLGRSFLKNFKSFDIDNSERTITFEY